MTPIPHERIVHATVDHLRSFGYRWQPVRDMVADGIVGALEAERSWSETGGANRETFASIRIRGAIIDGRRKAFGWSRTIGGYPKPVRWSTKYETTIEGDAEARADVARMLSRLPEREAMVLALVRLAGWSQVEVASELGLSKSWVCRLERRALALCREFAGAT